MENARDTANLAFSRRLFGFRPFLHPRNPLSLARILLARTAHCGRHLSGEPALVGGDERARTFWSGLWLSLPLVDHVDSKHLSPGARLSWRAKSSGIHVRTPPRFK